MSFVEELLEQLYQFTTVQPAFNLDLTQMGLYGAHAREAGSMVKGRQLRSLVETRIGGMTTGGIQWVEQLLDALSKAIKRRTAMFVV